MKTAKLIFAAVALAFALPAAAGEILEVSGTPLTQNLIARHLETIEASSGVELEMSAVGCGKAMLDLIEGKSSVAAVSVPLPQAIAAARNQAKAEGRSLVVPASLKFHEVARAAAGDRALAFVTVGAPGPELQKVLMFLRSHEGRAIVLAGL